MRKRIWDERCCLMPVFVKYSLLRPDYTVFPCLVIFSSPWKDKISLYLLSTFLPFLFFFFFFPVRRIYPWLPSYSHRFKWSCFTIKENDSKLLCNFKALIQCFLKLFSKLIPMFTYKVSVQWRQCGVMSKISVQWRQCGVMI